MGNVTLNGATSGSITLSPPAVAGTNTISLPAQTATVLTDSSAAMNIGSGQIYKDASGNVGIGTSSPGQRLDLGGGSLTLYNSTGTQQVYLYRASATNYSSIGTDSSAGGITFTTGTSAPSERMRIDSSGNVGIGTSSPFTKLHLTSNGAQTPSFAIPDPSNSRYSVGIGSYNVAGVGQRMDFYTGDSGANGTNLGSGALRMSLDSSGNLLVGTSTRGSVNSNSFDLDVQNGLLYQNHINGAVSGSAYNTFAYNGSAIGSITQNGTTAVAFNTTSDYRLKENVQPMTTGLTTINALKPVTYDWISDKSEGEGFIAHELQEVIPLAVTGEKDAVDADGKIIPQGVDYSKIVVHLVAAMQEQQSIIEDLKARLAVLEAK